MREYWVLALEGKRVKPERKEKPKKLRGKKLREGKPTKISEYLFSVRKKEKWGEFGQSFKIL